MKHLPTSRLICFLLISLCLSAHAQQQAQQKEKARVLSGVAVSADLVGFAMKACNAKYANMEVGARINILDKYFPAAELGIGDCKRESAETGNTFSATAPYMRFGLDYNFNKKHNGNRLFGLFRYGFSNFKYDVANKAFADPIFGTTVPLEMNGEKATGHWLEFGVGVETKLWKFIRLGWSMRYKFRISMKSPDGGDPYFIPGYGKNDTNGWGGTVNLVFDVGQNLMKKKQSGEANK